MTGAELAKFRARLQELARRIQGTAASVEEQARQATGGETAGGLSNAPMHLGDVGSIEYDQEIGAALLENEQYLQREILAALDRTEQQTFGQCQQCGQQIPQARLEVIPYARYCVTCAAELPAGPAVNLNEGRPRSWATGIGLRAEGPPPGAPGGPPEPPSMGDDPHAAGTPGGGSAVGGLAGTNVGDGSPDALDLEAAMGTGAFDTAIEGEPVGEDEVDGYSGPTGGAVGGTPANKRARGGNIGPTGQ